MPENTRKVVLVMEKDPSKLGTYEVSNIKAGLKIAGELIETTTTLKEQELKHKKELQERYENIENTDRSGNI